MDKKIDKFQILEKGFKDFLNMNYNHLTHKDVICSEAFYLFRQNFSMTPTEVLINENGIEEYKKILVNHFTNIERKNPVSNAATYCHATKLLKEYISKNKEITSFFVEEKKTYNKNSKNKSIPKPTISEVNKYLNQWKKLENYVAQEKALDKLFFYTYPKNHSMKEVLVKVSTLNDFYSTNIFSGYNVAKHIISLNIDNRLDNGDLTLVNEIAKVEMKKGKEINFYSFASKYCSHHKPDSFPIYDSYVDRILKFFKKSEKFFEFKNSDLKNYEKFNETILAFRQYYSLEKFTIKEIDKYLWLLGKENFPRNY